MEEVINRYGRQELIEGWNQDKLNKAKVAIVGAGHIGNFLASSLVALGVGDLRVYDDTRVDYEIRGKGYGEREFLLSRTGEGKSKVEALEKRIQKINPQVNVFGLHFELDGVTESLIERPDLIVCTTNNYDTAMKYMEYAQRNKIPIFNSICDRNKAIFIRNSLDIYGYDEKEQDGINAEVISGLLAGEVLQKIMYNENVETLRYSPSGNRFNETNVSINSVSLKDKKALVVGAGALGNFLGIGLTHAGVGKIFLIDDDVIETTNLNRQILFYDKVGEGKAETLAERLMEINPDIEVTSMRERVSEKFEARIKKIKPDLLIDCVDNLSTRAILNHFAIKYKIPLISGGTDYKAGQVVVYEPGKSSCLNCKLGVDEALVKEKQAHSCIHAPTPSVVVTNHIIGGLMAAEARCILSPENYGPAVRKTIKYDSTKGSRIGLIGSEEPCSCERKTTAGKWIKDLTEKVDSG
jgi:molybdopterin/thiamine biosynthesis adenylyltransferase